MAVCSRNPFDGPDIARAFAEDHYDNLRGRVRTEVIARQLGEHVPMGAMRVVDVGAGNGEQSLPLARAGHDVVLVEPSPEMRVRALRRVEDEPELRARVRIVAADGTTAPDHLDGERFDLVLCHGVLMYLDDPAPVLDALVAMTRPGGLLSIVATSRRGLAARAGHRGDFDEALRLFDADRYTNGLGLRARADDPDDLACDLSDRGVETLAWYGVRTFTDAWTRQTAPAARPDVVVAAEWEASRRDPYRQMSRLFHLLGRR